jgi:hypothetical protein
VKTSVYSHQAQLLQAINQPFRSLVFLRAFADGLEGSKCGLSCWNCSLETLWASDSLLHVAGVWNDGDGFVLPRAMIREMIINVLAYDSERRPPSGTRHCELEPQSSVSDTRFANDHPRVCCPLSPEGHLSVGRQIHAPPHQCLGASCLICPRREPRSYLTIC